MSIETSGIEAIEQKLRNLNTATQAKLLRKVANKVASLSKKRITAQTDLAGRKFTSRSPNTAEKLMRKKMLTGLRSRLRVLSVTDEQAIIGFTGRAEKIATEQQFGIKDPPKRTKPPSTGRGNSRSRREYNAADAASKKQALALVRLGYKAKVNGQLKVPTTKWIMDHLMYQKAGVIIQLMRKSADTERRNMYLPARSFLGVTSNDEQELLALIDDVINKEINK